MNISKLDDILKIKDAALSVLKSNGRMQDGFFQATTASLLIVHRTPFNRWHETPEEIKYFAALKGKAMNLPYGLDIWDATRKKVLNIEWANDGTLEVLSFKRGPWIENLVGLRTD